MIRITEYAHLLHFINNFASVLTISSDRGFTALERLKFLLKSYNVIDVFHCYIYS